LSCLGDNLGQVCRRACYKAGDCGKGLCSNDPSLREFVPTPNRHEYLTFCARACDLFKQDCGNAFEACYPVYPSTSVCFTTANGLAGSTCQYSQDCTAGNICPASTRKCTAMCNLDGGSPACSTGSCTVLQGLNVGACR
jgi:hypothetical protein